jgi:hypothetical protein
MERAKQRTEMSERRQNTRDKGISKQREDPRIETNPRVAMRTRKNQNNESIEKRMVLKVRRKRRKTRTQGRKFKRNRNSEKIGRVVLATKESK